MTQGLLTPEKLEKIRQVFIRERFIPDDYEIKPIASTPTGLNNKSEVYTFHLPDRVLIVKLETRQERADKEWQAVSDLKPLDSSFNGMLPINKAEDRFAVYRHFAGVSSWNQVWTQRSLLESQLASNPANCMNILQKTLFSLSAIHTKKPGKFDLHKSWNQWFPALLDVETRASLEKTIKNKTTREKILKAYDSLVAEEPTWASDDVFCGHIHGDLNFDNILVGIDEQDQPTEVGFIDFADSRNHAPIVLDYARLESEFWLEILPNIEGLPSEREFLEQYQTIRYSLDRGLEFDKTLPPVLDAALDWTKRLRQTLVDRYYAPSYQFRDYIDCLLCTFLQALLYPSVQKSPLKTKLAIMAASSCCEFIQDWNANALPEPTHSPFAQELNEIIEAPEWEEASLTEGYQSSPPETVNLVPLKKGDTYGKYKLEERLGKGSFGEVWKATEFGSNETYAIKFLLEKHNGDSTKRNRFRQGAMQLLRLQNRSVQNIITVYDKRHLNNPDQGRFFFVMPFIEHGNLEKAVEESRITIRDRLRFIEQIAEALVQAHSYNIIHRDIKPSNILLQNKSALLADFDLVSAEGGLNTSTDEIGGSPYFRPPEAETQGLMGLGKAGDVYSLAKTLFFLLFPKTKKADDYTRQALKLNIRAQDWDTEVCDFLSHALDPNPRKRISSMEEFATRLKKNSAALEGIAEGALVTYDIDALLSEIKSLENKLENFEQTEVLRRLWMHEMTNKMGHISSSITSSLETLYSHPEKAMQRLAEQPENIRRITTVTNNASKNVSLNDERTHFPLTDVLKLVEKNHISYLKEFGIEWKSVVDDSLWISIYFPSAYFIFSSLVNNAIKAMREHGGQLTFNALLNGGHVTCAVTDTGPGVAPENFDKIFTEWSKDPLGYSSLTHSGMGLTRSLKMIREASGNLEIDKLYWGGARFLASFRKTPDNLQTQSNPGAFEEQLHER